MADTQLTDDGLTLELKMPTAEPTGDVRVVLGGVDITRFTRRVNINAAVDKLNDATVELIGIKIDANVKAQIRGLGFVGLTCGECRHWHPSESGRDNASSPCTVLRINVGRNFGCMLGVPLLGVPHV